VRECRTLGSARRPPARAVPTATGAFYRSELYSLVRLIDEHLVRHARIQVIPWQALAGMGLAGQHTPASSQAVRPLDWQLARITTNRLVGAV
jgi:hypothetical protein